jgi:hypothetical protein
MTDTETNVEILQKAGIVHKQTTMNEHDEGLLNSLTPAEVRCLITIKNKLGVEYLKKCSKGGRFPHPDTSAF